jgi:hypothetical protein
MRALRFCLGLFAVPLLVAADLSSPLQAERDTAAALARKSFQPVPRSRWVPLLAELKPGATRESVLERLKPLKVTPAGADAGGGRSSERFRLDDSWVLTCGFRREGEAEVLAVTTLDERLNSIWIAPPADFTGIWITYYVNGSPSHRIEYRDGKYHGTFTVYHPTGGKWYEQHYVNHSSEGEDTGWFASGAVAYRAYYKGGKAFGTWTHYNEDGSVRSTMKHEDGKMTEFSPVKARASPTIVVTTPSGRKEATTRRYTLTEVEAGTATSSSGNSPFNLQHPVYPKKDQLELLRQQLRNGGELWYFQGLDSGWAIVKDGAVAWVLVTSHEW